MYPTTSSPREQQRAFSLSVFSVLGRVQKKKELNMKEFPSLWMLLILRMGRHCHLCNWTYFQVSQITRLEILWLRIYICFGNV